MITIHEAFDGFSARSSKDALSSIPIAVLIALAAVGDLTGAGSRQYPFARKAVFRIQPISFSKPQIGGQTGRSAFTVGFDVAAIKGREIKTNNAIVFVGDVFHPSGERKCVGGISP